ncbi:MAG: AI-2E family transporter [Anaerolineae bacterium]|nr:AI-2E family transporter [Anaerolineae bacterium]
MQAEDLVGEGGLLESVNLQQILDGLLNVAGAITSTVTSAITSVAGLAITLIMAVFLSFLILIDLRNAEGALDRWVPRRYHREYRLLLHEIVRVWNGFFRGQLIIGVIIGVLTWLQLVLMGVPGAEILAFFTGAVSLIPTIGGLAALVPLTLVPLLQGSTVFPEMSNVAFALIVVGVNLVLQQIIWNVVAPKILGDAVALPLAVIIVGVFIGSALGGILGAFLVAPIMGTIRVILLYLFCKIGGADPFPGREPPEPMPTFAEARVRIPRRRRP